MMCSEAGPRKVTGRNNLPEMPPVSRGGGGGASVTQSQKESNVV